MTDNSSPGMPQKRPSAVGCGSNPDSRRVTGCWSHGPPLACRDHKPHTVCVCCSEAAQRIDDVSMLSKQSDSQMRNLAVNPPQSRMSCPARHDPP